MFIKKLILISLLSLTQTSAQAGTKIAGNETQTGFLIGFATGLLTPPAGQLALLAMLAFGSDSPKTNIEKLTKSGIAGNIAGVATYYTISSMLSGNSNSRTKRF